MLSTFRFNLTSIFYIKRTHLLIINIYFIVNCTTTCRACFISSVTTGLGALLVLITGGEGRGF